MEKRFIDIKELAEYLDIKIGTVYSWVYQRKIDYFKIGRLVKFDMLEIDKWIEINKIKRY